MSITVKNLSYGYAMRTPLETEVLHDVSLTIERGQFVGIMGHTGCGKTTLIQLMAGLLTPSAGQIFLDDADINDKRYDRSILRRKLGMVFQYPECQLFETTVAKDVAFGLKHAGLSRQDVEKRVQWALEVTGFDYETVKELSPLGLSGGEKRRVAIAGILATQPEYLILDEPIAGLDPLGREDFLKLLTKLNAEGTTIVMVSHNADCLGAYASRILVLDHGKLVDDGTPSQVFLDVDQMKARQIGVSQCREIAKLLQDGGMAISQEITAYDDLLRAVLKEVGPCVN